MMVKKLGDSLRDIIPKRGNLKDGDKVFGELAAVVGAAWTDRMVNLGYASGRLRVGVPSHADLQEAQFQAGAWEQAMKNGGSKVRRIEFILDPET
ncbi:MAG: hypothetical protein AB7F75_01105 [Planctomycetota bacterium]